MTTHPMPPRPLTPRQAELLDALVWINCQPNRTHAPTLAELAAHLDCPVEQVRMLFVRLIAGGHITAEPGRPNAIRIVRPRARSRFRVLAGGAR